MSGIGISPNEGRYAIRVTVASIIVGGLWFAFLEAEPFPPDVTRVVPIIWFTGALVGLVFGLRATFANKDRLRGIVSIVLNVPNMPLSLIFLFAAGMGG